jgi:hypothetical protein
VSPERVGISEASLIAGIPKRTPDGPSRAKLSALPSWEGARVYFIGTADRRVKIGWSYNPQARLQSLQVASPLQLRLLRTIRGGPRQEQMLHEFYADERLHGEWFTASDRMVRFIARIKG